MELREKARYAFRWWPFILEELYATRRLDYAEEMMYWADVLQGKPESWAQDFHRADVKDCLDVVADNFKIRGTPVKVLELGAGPRSRMTEGYDSGLFDLVAVDPLADRYKKRFSGREFLMTGRGEDVDKKFPAESFHMAYASNAIDHGIDPRRIVEATRRVLKPKGVLAVCGNTCEGEQAGYFGIHRHDLMFQDGQLLWRTKGMDWRSLTDGFRHIAGVGQTYNYNRSKRKQNWFFRAWEKC